MQEGKKPQALSSVPEELTYQYFQANRYKISQCGNLQSICNNGFIKLYTLNTRVYWHAQNQFQHRVPDWKFHVSVSHEDLKRAWNLMVGLFIKLKCRAGMKVIYLRESQGSQRGRQITLYLVKIDDKFENSSFAKDYNVSLADEHSQEFWFNFVKEIQEALLKNQIKSNGLANGDLPIGKYVSLRNEAFVHCPKSDNYIYPPNNYGWNPLNQKIPIDVAALLKFISKDKEKGSNLLFKMTLPIFLVSVFWLLKNKQ